MSAPVGQGNAQYSVLSTNGTYTLNQQGVSPGAQPAIYYGALLNALGTSPVLTIVDIATVITGTGTTTNTNTLQVCTGTAAGQAFAPVAGVGIRCKGSLVAIATGTAAGTWLAAWD